MSRSKKVPMIVCTSQIDKDKAHRQLRNKVKSALNQQDFENTVLDADTRDIGVEEWGTKFGFETAHLFGEEDDFDKEMKIKASRK